MKYLFKDRKILTTRWQRFFFALSAHLVFPLKTKSGGVSSLQVLHWVRERERERERELGAGAVNYITSPFSVIVVSLFL
jgi:hypothetical protein